MFAKTGSMRDQATQAAADLLETLTPHVENARDLAAPHLETARERLINDVVPLVQSAIANASEQAAPVAEEAKRRGVAAAAALKGEQPVRRGGALKKLLVLGGLAGVAAVVAKKFLGDQGGEAAWQSSYAPSAPGSHSGSTAPTASTPATPAADDAAGADPTEALADATETPHDVTTPDEPADVTQISESAEPSDSQHD